MNSPEGLAVDGNAPADVNAPAVTPADANTLNGTIETVVEEANQAATDARNAVESGLPVGVGQ